MSYDEALLPIVSLSPTFPEISEGNTGSKTLTMTATLSAASTSAITVGFSTSSGSASAGSDFVATTGTLTFAAGETTKTFGITINGDQQFEGDETFFVELTSASGAVLATNGGSTAIAEITNDDISLLPIVSPSPTFPEISEGNTGSKTLTMTATLSAASTSAITVGFSTSSGSASAGSDFVATTGTLTFAAGETTKTFGITINGDQQFEGDETFFVELTSASGAVLATNGGSTAIAEITNDDISLLPIVSPSPTFPEISEGNTGSKTLTMTATLSAASTSAITVGFSTSSGSASAGSDFVATTGTLTFAAGETTKTFGITINGDQQFEGDETFFVELTSASGAVLATNGGSTAIAEITNDDVPLAITFSNQVSDVNSVGLTPDGQHLLIKIDGVISTVGINDSLIFSNSSLTPAQLISQVTNIPVFQSSGGSSGYVLPEAFPPNRFNLDYQLIEPTDNAVVIGGGTNDFIKVSSSNSLGKAVDGAAGDDVIDGGVGSTFISGGTGSDTIFLDGRAPGVSWSTVTDFKFGEDKATIWGWKAGVSRVSTLFTDFNTGGAPGYTGLTLHFENLLPDDAAPGQTNSNFNSITLTGLTLADFGATSLEALNAQITAGTNSHFITGQTTDEHGVHGYLFLS